MKTISKLYFLAIVLMVSACGGGGGDEQPDPCATPININISNVTAATQGLSDGSFTASATGGNGGFQFSIDGNNFQTSGTFSDLAAGDYTVTVRDSEGCTNTQQVTIEDGVAPVPSFANEVLPIMQARCATAGCHVNGGNAPFVIEGFGDVQPRAAAIRARVAGRTMPPSGATALTNDQIQTIVDWVDGGSPNN